MIPQKTTTRSPKATTRPLKTAARKSAAPVAAKTNITYFSIRTGNAVTKRYALANLSKVKAVTEVVSAIAPKKSTLKKTVKKATKKVVKQVKSLLALPANSKALKVVKKAIKKAVTKKAVKKTSRIVKRDLTDGEFAKKTAKGKFISSDIVKAPRSRKKRPLVVIDRLN